MPAGDRDARCARCSPAIWSVSCPRFNTTPEEGRRTGNKVSVWWVNQSESYRQEREAGILWAPHLTSDGRRQPHWESMSRLEVGDTVWHYAHGRLLAVGPVLTAAIDAQR